MIQHRDFTIHTHLIRHCLCAIMHAAQRMTAFANQVSLKVTWIRNMDYIMHVKYIYTVVSPIDQLHASESMHGMYDVTSGCSFFCTLQCIMLHYTVVCIVTSIVHGWRVEVSFPNCIHWIDKDAQLAPFQGKQYKVQRKHKRSGKLVSSSS